METGIIKSESSIIQNKIYEIRNLKVILDYDLAQLYQVETRVLNQAVKRNIERFPDDFMFQLTEKEWKQMSSQIVMTYQTKRPKSSIPYAFTEQGVAMLSGLLKSEIAVKMNIAIMRTFVFIRQYTTHYAELNRKLEEYMSTTDARFEYIYEVLDELMARKKELEKPRNPVGYIQYKNK